MRKYLLATLLLIFGIGFGIGAAYIFSKNWQPAPAYAAAPVNVPAAALQQAKTPVPPAAAPQTPGANLPNPGWNNYGRGMGSGMMGSGMMGGWNNNTAGQGYWGMGSGMMGGWNNNSAQGNWGMGSSMMGRGMMGNWRGTTPTGQRLTIAQALANAQKYVAAFGQNLAVAEIMEFNNNFYVSVRETAAGRGAFELLVDPFSGAVTPEIGPNMTWNARYGMMGAGQAIENTISMEQAIQQGQQFLDANLPGAQLQSDGASFYGYYTFDYKVNGQVAGMLSVNGLNGAVWPHTWHGQFIAEQEVK